MRDHRNPHGATEQELKEQKLLDSLLSAEFAWNGSKTLEEKKRALAQVNLALEAIEKFDQEKKSLVNRLETWENPAWIDKQAEEFSNLKEMGYSESEAEKYVGVLGNSVKEVKEILDLESKDYSELNWCHPHGNVQWDNQSWEEQRG